GAHRGAVRELRRPPRPRVPGRAAPDRVALLHQLGGAHARAALRRDVAADAVAIVVFTTVGLLAHGFEAAGYLRDALPLLVAWLAVGAAVGLYRRPSRARLLLTWLVAVPLAWLVRALVLGRDLDGGEVAFLGVSLAFTLVLVAAARAL